MKKRIVKQKLEFTENWIQVTTLRSEVVKPDESTGSCTLLVYDQWHGFLMPCRCLHMAGWWLHLGIVWQAAMAATSMLTTLREDSAYKPIKHASEIVQIVSNFSVLENSDT